MDDALTFLWFALGAMQAGMWWGSRKDPDTEDAIFCLFLLFAWPFALVFSAGAHLAMWSRKRKGGK